MDRGFGGLGADFHDSTTGEIRAETLRRSELSEANRALFSGRGILSIGPYGDGNRIPTQQTLATAGPGLGGTRLRGSRYSTGIPPGAIAILPAGLALNRWQEYGRVVHQAPTFLSKNHFGGQRVIDHPGPLRRESARVREHRVISGEIRPFLQCRNTGALNADLLNRWPDGYLRRVDVGPLKSRTSGELPEAVVLGGTVSDRLIELARATAEGSTKCPMTLAADWSYVLLENNRLRSSH